MNIKIKDFVKDWEASTNGIGINKWDTTIIALGSNRNFYKNYTTDISDNPRLYVKYQINRNIEMHNIFVQLVTYELRLAEQENLEIAIIRIIIDYTQSTNCYNNKRWIKTRLRRLYMEELKREKITPKVC